MEGEEVGCTTHATCNSKHKITTQRLCVRGRNPNRKTWPQEASKAKHRIQQISFLATVFNFSGGGRTLTSESWSLGSSKQSSATKQFPRDHIQFRRAGAPAGLAMYLSVGRETLMEPPHGVTHHLSQHPRVVSSTRHHYQHARHRPPRDERNKASTNPSLALDRGT